MATLHEDSNIHSPEDQAFNELNYRRQLLRLRKLALKALESYDLDVRCVRLLLHGYNTSFQVVATAQPTQAAASSAEGSPTFYTLRLKHTRHHSEGAQRFELEWLKSLREAGFLVPAPVPLKNGQMLRIVSIDGVPAPRSCALVTFLKGRFLRKGLTPRRLEQIGEFVAQLHAHGRGFRAAGLEERPCWNIKMLVGPNSPMGRTDNPALFAPDQIATIDRASDKVCAHLDRLGQGSDTFGLIHGDMHQGNYLFVGDRVAAIDFEECGPGFFLYELAVTINALSKQPNSVVLAQALLRGYRRVGWLPEDHQDYLKTFIVARNIALLKYLSNNFHNPKMRAWAPAYAAEVVRSLANFAA